MSNTANGVRKEGYFEKYIQLLMLPKYFWILIMINFFEIVGYTFVNTIEFTFFTTNVGMSQTETGTWFMLLGWAYTASAIIGGILIDRFGPKKTFIVFISIAIMARILCAYFDDSKYPALLFNGLAWCCTLIPMMYVYVLLKRYSNAKTSALVFMFQYLTMNFAFSVAGFALDWVRGLFPTLTLGLQFCFYLSGIIYIIPVILMAIFINDKKTVDENFNVVPYKPTISEDQQKSVWKYMGSTFREKSFWVFVAIMLITSTAKYIFSIPHVTLPNFMVNIIGPDAAMGRVGAINPIIIMVGILVLIPILGQIKTGNALFFGTMISGSSLLFYAIPGVTVGFMLFNLGIGTDAISTGYYSLIIFQMLVYSLGEMMWSPRLSEFTVLIAPKGKEGLYTSLALVPLMVNKFFQPLNGYLLDTYCYDSRVVPNMTAGMSYTDSPAMIFVIFFFILMVTPIFLFFFKGYVQKRIDEANKPSEANTEKKVEATQEA